MLGRQPWLELLEACNHLDQVGRLAGCRRVHEPAGGGDHLAHGVTSRSHGHGERRAGGGGEKRESGEERDEEG